MLRIFLSYVSDQEHTKIMFSKGDLGLLIGYMLFSKNGMDVSLHNIMFDTTTITIHIHDLPMRCMHVNTAKMIGNKIG